MQCAKCSQYPLVSKMRGGRVVGVSGYCCHLGAMNVPPDTLAGRVASTVKIYDGSTSPEGKRKVEAASKGPL